MNEPTQLDSTLRKTAVLFVDDERSILDSMRRLFRTSPWTIHVAESGAQALQLMETIPIDMVVSDMRMPEMTGAQYLEQVALRYPDTIRFILTGYADMESTVDAINKGKIFGYISKPWDNDQLKQTLEKALYTKELEAERNQLLQITKRQNLELQQLNNSLENKVAERTEELRKTLAVLDQAHAELKNAYGSSVKAFSRIIELRETKATGHGTRVAEHATQIAEKLQLDEQTSEQLYYAALLHDVGKMGLADETLNKPIATLNEQELIEYKRHPVLGEASLMAIDSLHLAATFIRHHHESVDGSGYPDGLIGEEIPIGARIISIVADYDDLIQGFFVNGQVTPEKAIEFLKKAVNKRYDAQIAQAYLSVLGKEFAIKNRERLLRAIDLKEGMTLSKDITTREGMMLLAKGNRLSHLMIEKIRKYERESESSFPVYVYNEDD